MLATTHAAQKFFLFYAKLVLFIDDDQAQAFELDVSLKDAVSTNQDVDFTIFDGFQFFRRK
ncbi:hypothetical protein D3C85_1469820 [compost metagenome]